MTGLSPISDVVVRAEGLGKRYCIRRDVTRQGALHDFLLAPFGSRRRGGRQADAAPQEIWALRDVSFSIERGEIVAIIGRNGAGKSTLLKVLSQITAPTEGRVEVFGQVGSLLEVGTGFHPELTGRENVYLNGAILGMRRAEIDAKFAEIVAFSGVGAFLDMPVKYFSSGMYLRLAFAVGAHLHPDILLVDEVLSVGDIEFQRKCMGTMEKVAADGRTVVVVSHSMSLVKALCTRGILLDRGRVVVAGPIDEVVAVHLGGARSASADQELAEAHHVPGGGAEIRARRIRVLEPAHGSFAVYWRQPISLLVDIDVLTPVDNVSFGVGLRLEDGTFVFVVYNDDGGRPRWNLERGGYTVRVTIENELRPGSYVLHLGGYQELAAVKNLFAVDAGRLEVLEFTREALTPGLANPGLIAGVKSTFDCERRRRPDDALR